MGLFREYDLRGVVGQELTDSIAEQVGRAYCTYVKDRGVKTISVGRDGRLSSPGLHKALVRGTPCRRTERGGHRSMPLATRVFLSISATG